MLRRASIEAGVVVTLMITIVAVACAASWSVSLRAVASPVRAIALAALCLLALAYAATRTRTMARLPLTTEHVVVAALLVLAAVSVAWSVRPSETVTRGGAFGLLVLAAAAIGIGAAGDTRAARRILTAVLAAAVLVSSIGVLVYLVSSGDALQAATAQTGARFRGIGQSPNTASMLFAVALPAAAFGIVAARSLRVRIACGGAFLLLAGSIGMSGSRGALAAAAVGVLLFGWATARRWVHRAWITAGVAAFAAALLGLGSLPQPLSGEAAAKAKSPSGNTERYTPNDAEYIVRLEDEVGYSDGASSSRRGTLGSSGRLDAWRGALEQGEDRPLLGYGFGTEDDVFVDRFQSFQGGVPENSFIGLFLQLGAVGIALFAALVVMVGRAAAAAHRVDRSVMAACIGMTAAGLTLALVQSYIYAIGNVATLAVWVAAFLAVSLRTDAMPSRVPAGRWFAGER
jgi:hypothetical protein